MLFTGASTQFFFWHCSSLSTYPPGAAPRHTTLGVIGITDRGTVIKTTTIITAIVSLRRLLPGAGIRIMITIVIATRTLAGVVGGRQMIVGAVSSGGRPIKNIFSTRLTFEVPDAIIGLRNRKSTLELQKCPSKLANFADFKILLNLRV